MGNQTFFTKSKILEKVVKPNLQTFIKLKIFEKQDSYFYNQVAIDFLIKLSPERYFYKNFLEKVFSLKNYKYITVFGVKRKIKRKRKWL